LDKRILVLFAGGTIQCVEDNGVRHLSDEVKERLRAIFVEYTDLPDKVFFDEINHVEPKLSENMETEDWIRLGHIINSSAAEKVIVCHGTDNIDAGINILDMITNKTVLLLGSYFTLNLDEYVIYKNIKASVHILSKIRAGRAYGLVDGVLIDCDRGLESKGIPTGAALEKRGLWINPLRQPSEKVLLERIKPYSVLVIDSNFLIHNKSENLKEIFHMFDRVMIIAMHSGTIHAHLRKAILSICDKNRVFISVPENRAVYAYEHDDISEYAIITSKFNTSRLFSLLSISEDVSILT